MRLSTFVEAIGYPDCNDRSVVNTKLQYIFDTVTAYQILDGDDDGDWLLSAPKELIRVVLASAAYDSFYTGALYRLWSKVERSGRVLNLPLAATLNFAVQTLSMLRQPESLSQGYLQIGCFDALDYLAAAINAYAICGTLIASDDELRQPRDKLIASLSEMRVEGFAVIFPNDMRDYFERCVCNVGVVAICNRPAAQIIPVLATVRSRLTLESKIVLAGDPIEIEKAVEVIAEAGPPGLIGRTGHNGIAIVTIENHHMHNGA